MEFACVAAIFADAKVFWLPPSTSSTAVAKHCRGKSNVKLPRARLVARMFSRTARVDAPVKQETLDFKKLYCNKLMLRNNRTKTWYA